MKENKLWVLPTTNAALAQCLATPHSYGNADHCLFIGPEGPAGSREVTGELVEYLTDADWRWIYAESDKIRAEQEELYRAKLENERKAFLRRFDAELEKAMAEESPISPDSGAAGNS